MAMIVSKSLYEHFTQVESTASNCDAGQVKHGYNRSWM